MMSADSDSGNDVMRATVKWKWIKRKSKFRGVLLLGDDTQIFEYRININGMGSRLSEIRGYSFPGWKDAFDIADMRIESIEDFCGSMMTGNPMLSNFIIIPFIQQRPDALKMNRMKKMIMKYLKNDPEFLDDMLLHNGRMGKSAAVNLNESTLPGWKLSMHKEAINDLEKEIAQMKMKKEVQDS